MKIPFYLEQLVASVPHNCSVRFNCPKCRGSNTLGITKENGKVKWHCFRATCNLKPNSAKYNRNTSELRTQLLLDGRASNTLVGRNQQEAHTEEKEEFRIPDYLIPGLASKKSLQMIMQGNCLEVYKQGLFDVMYDPQQDRVCFVIKNDNEIQGLVGKACNKTTKPKVRNYGNVDRPFIVGNSTNTLVLVEDCISAASACRIPAVSGLALLGSSIKAEYIPTVKNYGTIIVALDRDARKKALAIKRKLCYYHSNVKMWLLDKDIKDMTDEEILCKYRTVTP